MSEPAHIFVYGTLRVGHDHPMARRLASRARFIGTGSVPGYLYDMGWYPAALFDDSANDRVHGDVFALGPGGHLLAELDDYEAGGPDYMREPRQVLMADRKRIAAWAYGVANPPDAPVIPGGDFLGFWRAKERLRARP